VACHKSGYGAEELEEVPYWWILRINVIVLSAGQTVEPLAGAFGEEVLTKRTAHEWCYGY
jgi:hypothetical protein